MVKTQLTREHGYAAARELLSRPDRPTAVFTANDMQALGVYQAARELGLRIPHELSVVGFDDVPAVASWLWHSVGVRKCRRWDWRSRPRSPSGRARRRRRRSERTGGVPRPPGGAGGQGKGWYVRRPCR